MKIVSKNWFFLCALLLAGVHSFAMDTDAYVIKKWSQREFPVLSWFTINCECDCLALYKEAGDGCVVGGISYSPRGNHIELLYVKDEERGKGYGTALLKEVIKHFTQKEVKSISLYASPKPHFDYYGTVFTARDKLVQFYKKFGFEVSEKIEAGATGVSMSLSLSQIPEEGI